MKGIIKWVLDNALIALGMVVASAITAGIYQAGEIGPSEYRMLANSWGEVDASTQGEVRQALASGTITRWEQSDLVRSILASRHGFIIEIDGVGTVDQERASLLRKVEHGR